MSPHQVVAEYWAESAAQYGFAARVMAEVPAMLMDEASMPALLTCIKQYAAYAAHDAGIVLRERARAQADAVWEVD